MTTPKHNYSAMCWWQHGVDIYVRRSEEWLFAVQPVSRVRSFALWKDTHDHLIITAEQQKILTTLKQSVSVHITNSIPGCKRYRAFTRSSKRPANF